MGRLWWTQLLLAPLAAWLTFARGRRFGAGAWRAAAFGAPCLVLATLPVWSRALARAWHPFDPRGDYTIDKALAGSDGLVFVNVNQQGFELPLVADVRDGTWRVAGARGDRFLPLSSHHGSVTDGLDPGAHALLLRVPWTGDEMTVVDGRTGGDVLTYGWNAPLPAALAPRMRDELRATTPLRLPDGRRTWFFQRRREEERADGGFQRGDPGCVPTIPIGFGCVAWARKGGRACIGGVHDLVRDRTVPFTGASDFDALHVLPRAWLLREARAEDVDPRTRVPHDLLAVRAARWTLRDPDSGDERPALGLGRDDRVAAVLDDGTLLVALRRGAAPGDSGAWAFHVDAETGARDALTFPRAWPQDRERVPLRDACSLNAPLRTPAGSRLFQVNGYGQQHLARLDLERRAFTLPIPCASVLACVDEDTALVVAADRRGIERVRFDTGARTVVWPR